MYERFFGLQSKPFAVTPDPRFLYSSRGHREALASLVYGVKEGRGFIGLVGEVGTGKTTLLRALLETLDVSIRTVLITHTTVDRDDLLRMILHDLDMPCDQFSRVQVIQSLHDLVLLTFEAHLPPPVIIVDEAQNLADDVLEEIRLLTNLEVGDSKLVQVILSGQPELERRLETPTLRQLGQRVAVRARLEPLGEDDTAAYVRHRLKVGGAMDVDLFSTKALATVWRRTGGLPRLINVVCEQALVNAFGAGRKKVDESLVDEAVRDLGLNTPVGSGPAVGREARPVARRWSRFLGLAAGGDGR